MNTKLTASERLRRWAHFYAIDWKAMQKPPEPPPPIDEKASETYEILCMLDSNYSPMPTEIGEVRMLDFEHLGSDECLLEYNRVIHVAIIEMKAGMVSFVRVGQYLDAGIPYELNLETPVGESFHVLQINTLLRLPIQVFEKGSWVVGHLDSVDLERARMVARARIRGNPVDKSVVDHCGLPILHPKDPRHSYIKWQHRITVALQRVLLSHVKNLSSLLE